MDRRKFLKIASMTGLSVVAPVFSRPARAAAPYAGPFFVMISARGGWDPTYYCDPKPPGAFNNGIYMAPKAAGNLSFAPIAITQAGVGLNDPLSMGFVMSNDAFFSKHSDKLLVVNGVNMETNNHLRGVTTIWSGRGSEGYPSLGALLAAAKDPTLPLAFISSGGYDATEKLVPVTRLSSVTPFRKIAEPNRIVPTDPDNLARYHMSSTFDRIRAAQGERLQAQVSDFNLPTMKRSGSALFLARQGDDTLASVPLPDTLITMPTELSDLQRMCQQIQFALAAFEAGLAVAVNLELGGFDTHGNHDRDQVRQLAKLNFGIDYLISEAQAKGLDGSMITMVGADFGRGKGYNGPNPTDGKDHWPVGSAMFFGAGIAGNRVVGGTDDADQLPLLVDPETLELTDDEELGVELKCADLHVAMREFAAIDGSDEAGRYPLLANELSGLFTG
ncbi:MAG: DUF1501 domain-containing protein [Myxococcales bacterium]|nr:DUF1501 domain-containing protein [Myxococcales bacterium]MCB9752597.1 DUF1501 domain-containing protein [Myxococcales bacterium]